MKRTVVILILSLITSFFSACLKETKGGCKPATPQSEEGAIQAYAASNGISAVKHSTGLFYEILSEGTGTRPTLNSVVGITYTGKTTNNVIFDQSTTQKDWPLDRLIAGWQIGLPLIKEGGSIILLVPSSMAYGCESPSPQIPSNSILVFNINLLDVK
jgi:FKBP-type peptidyl-prolyl cis-trans isomerase FkpA